MQQVPLKEIFDVAYGGNFSKVSDYQSGDTPVIKSQATNNGVIAFLDIEPNCANIISVARTGSVGASFYHEYNCYVTDDCMVMTPKIPLNRTEMLVYSRLVYQNSFKYNYGRKVTPTRLSRETLPHPEDVAAIAKRLSMPAAPPSQPATKCAEKIDIRSRLVRSFSLQSLFDIKKGQRLTKANMVVGSTPFIGAIESGNGCRQYVSAAPNHAAGTITVSYNGSVGEAFYQPVAYWASDDINVLYPKFEMNPLTALFICTLIRQEKFRFNYGRKWHLGRMNESTIKLPAKADGQPDWEFIESYVKALPYSVSL